jgi:hypothetical protein
LCIAVRAIPASDSSLTNQQDHHHNPKGSSEKHAPDHCTPVHGLHGEESSRVRRRPATGVHWVGSVHLTANLARVVDRANHASRSDATTCLDTGGRVAKRVHVTRHGDDDATREARAVCKMLTDEVTTMLKAWQGHFTTNVQTLMPYTFAFAVSACRCCTRVPHCICTVDYFCMWDDVWGMHPCLATKVTPDNGNGPIQTSHACRIACRALNEHGSRTRGMDQSDHCATVFLVTKRLTATAASVHTNTKYPLVGALLSRCNRCVCCPSAVPSPLHVWQIVRPRTVIYLRTH